MNERTKLIRRVFGTLFLGTFLFSLLFIFSCDSGSDDDPEPELYPIPGIYIFQKAILQSSLTVGPFTIPAGTDITDNMAGGLLAEANCDDPENGAIDLKADKSMFFTCLTESNETQAGLWSINADTTELSLSMSAPPLPNALQLKVEDLEINEATDVIGGDIISFPLTPDLIEGFLQGLSLTQEVIDGILASLPAVTPVDVYIEFKKVSE